MTCRVWGLAVVVSLSEGCSGASSVLCGSIGMGGMVEFVSYAIVLMGSPAGLFLFQPLPWFTARPNRGVAFLLASGAIFLANLPAWVTSYN